MTRILPPILPATRFMPVRFGNVLGSKGKRGQGGEVFVLDMGEPVKIVRIAEELIRLHGMEPNRDIDIQFTGLRPGELNRDRAPISPEEIGALSLFNSTKKSSSPATA